MQSEVRAVVASCVRSVFHDAARQIACNESRIVYTLPSTIKWEEVMRVDRTLREQPVRACLMSRDGTLQLVFVAPSPQPPPGLPNRLLMRAIRGMIRQCLNHLTEAQQQSMLFLTMRVNAMQSTDGSLMTEGISFKPNEKSVTIIARLGANRLIDAASITRIFESYTTNGLLTTTDGANQETRKGLSPEGKVCSDEGLLPLVLYVDVPHEQLGDTKTVAKKRAAETAVQVQPRKRGLLSFWGLFQ